MIASSRHIIAFRNQLDNRSDAVFCFAKLVGGLIMARNAALPILTAEPGFTHYLEEIRRFPMLERQEEYLLGQRWREHGGRDAAPKLVTSPLRPGTQNRRDYHGHWPPNSP